MDPIPLLQAAALLVLAAGCASVAADGPEGPLDPRTRVPPGIPSGWVHFADPRVAPGDPAPDFALTMPDGRTALSLSTFRGRPLVLVFGSYT